METGQLSKVGLFYDMFSISNIGNRVSLVVRDVDGCGDLGDSAFGAPSLAQSAVFRALDHFVVSATENAIWKARQMSVSSAKFNKSSVFHFHKHTLSLLGD